LMVNVVPGVGWPATSVAWPTIRPVVWAHRGAAVHRELTNSGTPIQRFIGTSASAPRRRGFNLEKPAGNPRLATAPRQAPRLLRIARGLCRPPRFPRALLPPTAPHAPQSDTAARKPQPPLCGPRLGLTRRASPLSFSAVRPL